MLLTDMQHTGIIPMTKFTMLTNKIGKLLWLIDYESLFMNHFGNLIKSKHFLKLLVGIYLKFLLYTWFFVILRMFFWQKPQDNKKRRITEKMPFWTIYNQNLAFLSPFKSSCLKFEFFLKNGKIDTKQTEKRWWL